VDAHAFRRHGLKGIFALMTRIRGALLVSAAMACGGENPPSRPPPPPLATGIHQLVAASGAASVGLYFRDLGRPDSLLHDADLRFHAASTMKVPVMIQVFRDVETGRLKLGDTVEVRNEFTSIVDGSPYELDRADDSDSTLYDRIGRPATVRELVELMITVSSNLATNILMDLADPGRVTATMRELGADSIRVLRGVEDQMAYDAGLNNTTTARDLGVILGAIAENRAAGEESCRAMEEILARQRFNEGIPAGLPAGTHVAHKTGWITGLNHDAAIVGTSGGPRYVLVVLVRGLEDQAAARRLIADVARLVHGHVTAPPPAPADSR
jgi:beta-lactamase class A